MNVQLQLPLKRRGRPLRKLPEPLEHELQVAVAAHLALRAKPDWEWSHFPAGEKRNPITGSRLKMMGLKRGWPDFILISPEGRFHGLELKRKGEELNRFQQGFHDRCFARRIEYAVADDIDEALRYLTVWEVIPA